MGRVIQSSLGAARRRQSLPWQVVVASAISDPENQNKHRWEVQQRSQRRVPRPRLQHQDRCAEARRHDDEDAKEIEPGLTQPGADDQRANQMSYRRRRNERRGERAKARLVGSHG